MNSFVLLVVVGALTAPTVGAFGDLQAGRSAVAPGGSVRVRANVAEAFEVGAQFGASALASDGTPLLDAGAHLQWRLLQVGERSLAVSLTALVGWAGVWPTWGATVLGRATGATTLAERWALSCSLVAGALYDAALLRYEGRLALPLGGSPIVMLRPSGGVELTARFKVTSALALVAMTEIRGLLVFSAVRPAFGASLGTEVSW